MKGGGGERANGGVWKVVGDSNGSGLVCVSVVGGVTSEAACSATDAFGSADLSMMVGGGVDMVVTS